MEKERINNCCICGRTFKGCGNNPYPVKDFGRCCDMCNGKIVIPARLTEIIQEKEE